MSVHKNARLTPSGRALLAERIETGWSTRSAAEAAGVSVRTARKWLGRHRLGGERRHHDRSSAPRRCPRRTEPRRMAEIEALRRQRMTGPQIARRLGMARSTVGLILRRLGLGRLALLEPRPPVIRYELSRPGEMIHLDIKKLGRFDRVGHRITGDRTGQSNTRGIGWEYVHVCIDDASRVAFSQILPDERKESAVAFLKAALVYYTGLGVTVSRVMTDNGSCYKSKAFAKACRDRSLKHIRTKPYTPKTNGKAERFIQTALREWAYAVAYPTSIHRAAELPVWMHRYNWHRPHGSLKSKTPISRLGLTKDNLLRLHSCELSEGCPFGPDRGDWSCHASDSPEGPNEHS